MRTVAALSVLSVAFAAPTAKPNTFPIVNGRANFVRDDGTANYAAIFASMNRTLAKYKVAQMPYIAAIAEQQQQQGLLGLKKRASGTDALTDQADDGTDEDYYGPSVIGCGDGKCQDFTLDFDTGSADIFIPGPTCGTSEGCDGTTKYDEGGVNEDRTTSVTYGSGEVEGNDYADDVTVAGLKALNQTLISLTEASGFSTLGSDGLMGMGFSTIAETGEPTYFETLMSQGTPTVNEFAFFLGRSKSGTEGQSELTLGGRDTSKYSGTPTAVAVTTPGYWQVALDSVQVNGESAGPTTEGQAAIDTGTTLVIAPTIALAAIALAIPGAFIIPVETTEFLAYPCDTSTKYIPAIEFGSNSYAINELDFNLGTVSSAFGIDLGNSTLTNILTDAIDTYCIAGVAGADIDPTENLYVVGDTFIKNWYSIFTYGSPNTVSFAPAVGNNAAA